MTGDELPPDFSRHVAFKQRLGSLQLLSRSEPACLWTVATGYIGPSLLRKELGAASKFANVHTDGWSYVVDTRGVRVINPINPLVLRRIPRLPNLSRYVVIAPRWIRMLARLGAKIVRPTDVVASPEEAIGAMAVGDD